MTLAISGRLGSGSSASVALSESLASRLQARSIMVGSTVYRQTWKRRITPLGRLYWEHTARARRTNDNDYSGWATPTARDHKDSASILTNTPVNGLLGRQVLMFNAPTGRRESLNPEFSRWLMGFSQEWLNCAVSATRSSRK